jgi:hypothetical protein
LEFHSLNPQHAGAKTPAEEKMNASARIKKIFGGILFSVMLMLEACGGGSGGGGSVNPVARCGVAAAENPAGGGGTAAMLTIDPAAYGTASVANLDVFGFSQIPQNDPADPQIFQLAPDIVMRAWQRWDRQGLAPGDYNFSYPAAAHDAGIVFIGGTTASVLFPDEVTATPALADAYSCNAAGTPVQYRFSNLPPLYRGSLASPVYRQYLIDIGKIQIDGGVDGLFYDEIDVGYFGSGWDGNGGFDDAHVADFGGFLCAKYSHYSAEEWAEHFGVKAIDSLDCSLPAAQRGRAFDYRGYLQRHGWTASPMIAANPLAAEWGWTMPGHPEPSSNEFVETYPSYVYWQQIVVALRNYARTRYGREIYITSNGVFPFVDFQSIGLWEPNGDGVGGGNADYVPTTPAGHLRGTESLLEIFRAHKQRSARIAGRIVPVVAFVDWPTPPMSRYLALPARERRDYWRMYAAEAYAAGIRLAFHLRDTVAPVTATDLGVMSQLVELRNFYKSHASLYRDAVDVGPAHVSAANIVSNVTSTPNGVVAHLINHNYASGFITRSAVAVDFPMAHAPDSVTLVSPDAPDAPVDFIYSAGRVYVTVPQLMSYVAVVAN